jgi:hypothetical protein
MRVFGAAFAVVALSILILTAMTTVYALVLALQARGAPDQSAINHFAASVSPKLMPWLEMSLTLLVAFRIARRAPKAGITHGLAIGILAGLLSLAVALAFGVRLGFHSMGFLAVVAGLGWLGGLAGQWRAT